MSPVSWDERVEKGVCAEPGCQKATVGCARRCEPHRISHKKISDRERGRLRSLRDRQERAVSIRTIALEAAYELQRLATQHIEPTLADVHKIRAWGRVLTQVKITTEDRRERSALDRERRKTAA